MILRHVGITVSDLEEALFFYRDLLGLSVVKIMDEKGQHIDAFSNLTDVNVRTVKLKDSSDAMIELLYYRSHPRRLVMRDIADIGCSHFAITVDDLDEILVRLGNKGYQPCAQPQFSPDGKVKLTFIKGPDNVLIEAVEELKC